MTSYREQVARALRAVEVTSTTSFRWFGCPSPRLAPEMTAALSRGPARKYLIGRIERELYRSFYTQGDPVPIRSSPESFSSDAGFVETLSAANRGAGGWDPGWQIAQIEPLQVTKNGLRVQVAHADCRLEGTGLSVGAEASLRRPKGEPAFFPGFYMAVGNADPIAAPDDLEVRLYFHVTGDGAVPLTALTTRVLNEARIPFRLKLLADRRAYVRCDAAVLYLREDGFADVRSELGYIVSAWRTAPPVPGTCLCCATRARGGGRRASASLGDELRGCPVSPARRGDRRFTRGRRTPARRATRCCGYRLRCARAGRRCPVSRPRLHGAV